MLTSLEREQARKEYKKAWDNANPRRVWARFACKDAKKRAVKKNVPFEITAAYILSILTDKCPVFGTDFVYRGNKGILPTSPSLDRIDPKKGYVEGNIVVISSRANSIKSNATWQEILVVSTWLRGVVE